MIASKIKKPLDKESMLKATEALKSNWYTYRVSKYYVVRSTFNRGLKEDAEGNTVQECEKGCLKRTPVSSKLLDNKLAEYYIKFQNKRNQKHNESSIFTRHAMSGEEMDEVFHEDSLYPRTSLRKPQAMSAARVKFIGLFRFHQREMEIMNISSHRLFKVDEMGITVVHHKH